MAKSVREVVEGESPFKEVMESSDDSIEISTTATGKISWKVKVYGMNPEECENKIDDVLTRLNKVMEKHGF